MKVFHLYPNSKRYKHLKSAEWTDGDVDPFSGYDLTRGAVVRAETEEDARQLMQSQSRSDEMYWDKDHRYTDTEDEDAVYYDGIWTNEKLVACDELTGEDDEKVIMRDFRAG